MRRAEKDGAQQSVVDDLAELRLRDGVERGLDLLLRGDRLGDEVPVAAGVDERVPVVASDERRIGEGEGVRRRCPAVGRDNDRDAAAGRLGAEPPGVPDRQIGEAGRGPAVHDDPVSGRRRAAESRIEDDVRA